MAEIPASRAAAPTSSSADVIAADGPGPGTRDDRSHSPQGARIARLDAGDEGVTFLGYLLLGAEEASIIEMHWSLVPPGHCSPTR